MGLSKVRLSLVLSALPLLLAAQEPMSDPKHHALFMMQSQSIDEALVRYVEYAAARGHDFEVLQRMGQIFFSHGIQSEDLGEFTMTLFGAGLSGSSASLEILERGLYSEDPQTFQHSGIRSLEFT